MAVAGLHNVSAFGPFFGESQSPSRQWGDEPGTPGTRASALLQMWRELEGERVVSRSHRLSGDRNDNGHDIVEDVDEVENQVIKGSETDHDDNNSIISEQASNLGEIERERVRQIFREWMNSGAVSPSSNEFHLSNRSGPQWLGENECERVRIIREWVQMNSQQRNSQDSGSQIEQVRDGLAVTHPEIGARRPIRRLCGRQTLLDLLQRAQCERKEELQSLLEQKPVSDFIHRNRIQAFLRGRFLRNERVIPNQRPSSVAATELGLLRQRHTVSGLREGFLSKLEKSASSTSANSTESDLWFGDPNNCESESACMESETMGISTTSDLEIIADGDRSQNESVREVTEMEDPVLPNMWNEHVSSENEEQEQEASLCVEENQQEGTNATITNELPLETEDINQSRPIEASHEHYQPRSGESSVHEAATHIAHLEGNTDQFHESVTETEDRAWQQLTSVAHTEWVDDSGESIARSWHESSANQLLPQTSHNNAIEQDQMQESHEDWPSHDLQEAIDSWLDLPSGEVGSSVGRIDTFYFSDDDNVHSIELRELFSRRRVSSLLRSGFRESLDQVLQSHVERLGHASHDWELDNASSSTSLADQEPEQHNGDQSLDLSNASQPLWDEEMQDASLPLNNLNHHLGMDWEVVNELRMDMARLQERLNNMQSMLEQCMDMQIELQRSVRQEVSAALNRSILTRGTFVHDESQLDYVRRGICCLCHDSNIDSLLHRCGHMCTCSKCAEKLTHDKTGKCPMCRAPVVEAVRAYFIQ